MSAATCTQPLAPRRAPYAPARSAERRAARYALSLQVPPQNRASLRTASKGSPQTSHQWRQRCTTVVALMGCDFLRGDLPTSRG